MISFDPDKRETNLKDHGIDLAECATILDYPMVTYEDTSEAYGEQRLKSLGWFRGRVVVLIWTERPGGAHLISCRHAEKHEIRQYRKEAL